VKIKVSEKKNPFLDLCRNSCSRYFKKQSRQLRIVAIVIYSLLLLLTGILVHKTGVIEEKIKPAWKKKRVFLKHVTKGKFLANPESIIIDIKHTDFQKLEYKRQQALEMNKLVTEDEDFVSAGIRYKNKNIKAELRLKGDHTDHLQGNKWSFRIRIKGNETLFGMRLFSIQHPKTRTYIHEWLYHEALRREKLIALRYDFINVTLNGKDLGIYALEEFFEKRLIENSRHREGPIIRFDESMMWQDMMHGGTGESGSYLSSSIDVFQTNRTLNDPVLRQQFNKAASLLESFRKGDLKTSDVFDADKLATFAALSDLMGAEHATRWINMRFYFNPITLRLEPIGFDANCLPINYLSLTRPEDPYLANISNSTLEDFRTALLNDREFYLKYIKELKRVSNPDYFNSFFNEIEETLEQKLNIIYKEFPHYNFSKDIYYNNIHIINTTLDPVKHLNVYLHKIDKDGIELELGNIQSMDVEVTDLSHSGSGTFKPTQPVILPGKDRTEPVEYKPVKFLFPKGFVLNSTDIPALKLNCKILGTDHTKHETVLPYKSLDKFYIDSDILRQKPNTNKFDFIIINEREKRLTILPGQWTISKDLVIPQGYTVTCSENTKINLLNKAKIISYSPLEFLGTQQNPVIINSEDSTGEGIAVMCKNRKSVLKNVVFENLAAPQQTGWGLTGAVNFYESPVTIYRCTFAGNRSEDGLNIIRSEFAIEETIFRDTFSDAFDADFCKGKITNSSFIRCGNDGIDVSGSIIEITDVLIDTAGDKGISIGEVSNAEINNIEVKDSNIAVACKDASTGNIYNANISGCKIGFAVYRKKSEYGPAELDIISLNLEGTEKKFLLEKGSRVTLDEIKLKAKKKKVYNLLYGKK